MIFPQGLWKADFSAQPPQEAVESRRLFSTEWQGQFLHNDNPRGPWSRTERNFGPRGRLSTAYPSPSPEITTAKSRKDRTKMHCHTRGFQFSTVSTPSTPATTCYFCCSCRLVACACAREPSVSRVAALVPPVSPCSALSSLQGSDIPPPIPADRAAPHYYV